MPPTNLAIVWAPNLLKSPNETPQTAFAEMSICNNIITFIIVNQEELFR